jgi:hypothetical protein
VDYKQMPRTQAVPLGDGDPLGLVLGDPLVVGEPDGVPLGLVVGEPDGDPLGLGLGDAFVLPAAPWLVAPVRPTRLGPLADPVPGDGRAPGVVALAGVDTEGAWLASGAG